MESRTSIQSMALEIAKVANKVSNVLNMPVTVDQVVQISQILNGEKSVGTVATKTATKLSPKKKETKSVANKPLDWSGFDWECFFDGEIHTVTAQEIRDFFGWGHTVKSSLVLNKFQRRIGICAMANKLKLRSHIVKTGKMAGKAIEVQLY